MDNAERQLRAMEGVVAWLEFENRDRLVAVLSDVLADARHIEAFDLSDGTRTQSEIAKQVGLSQPTISALWARWRRIRVVFMQEDGRARHLMSATELGIHPPQSRVVKGASDAD